MPDIEFILNWLAIDLDDPDSLWQVLASVLIVVTVGVINHYLTRAMTARLPEERRRLQHLSMKAFMRLFAPLIALMLFMLTRYVFASEHLAYGILDIAVPLALSLAVIRFTVYVLRKTFVVTPILKTWENVIVIIIWGLFVLHILDLLPGFLATLDSFALKVGQSSISLLDAIKAVLSISGFVIIALWLSNRVERKLAKTKDLASHLRIVIAKTVRVVALVVAFLIALNVIGFDLTTLTVLGGALGVGIGFGLQRIASNFISGFILLFDRSIRPNDVITVGNSFGWVKELHARYIVVQDRNGVETLIPNENLVTSEVINWSYTNKNVRVKVPVQISYQNDPEQAMALMVEAAREQARTLNDPEPVTRLLGFGDNGINLELRLWISDPENGINGIRSDVNVAIWRKFREQGVTIPYPQRDVRLIDTQGNAPTQVTD